MSMRTNQAKKILLIAANPAVSKQTGWPIGFWWAELTHPYAAFREAGHAVEIRSPAGGPLQADSYSDPEDPSGYSAEDLVSLGFKKSPAHIALIQDTRSIAGADVAQHDAVFVLGGQSPMYTFRGNAELAALVAAFHQAGKPTALVCHGTCVLLEARLASGRLLVDGRTWTGFATAEEKIADSVVGQRIQPFWIEEEARKIPATRFVTGEAFRPFAVRDGNLVTGQQQVSGRAAAELVIALLESPALDGVEIRGQLSSSGE
jgi:putative intracellular protease/amidase